MDLPGILQICWYSTKWGDWSPQYSPISAPCVDKTNRFQLIDLTNILPNLPKSLTYLFFDYDTFTYNDRHHKWSPSISHRAHYTQSRETTIFLPVHHSILKGYIIMAFVQAISQNSFFYLHLTHAQSIEIILYMQTDYQIQ